MNTLKQHREAAGLTQMELAKRTGIDQGYISKLENGHADATGRYWKMLAKVLGCSVGELMG